MFLYSKLSTVRLTELTNVTDRRTDGQQTGSMATVQSCTPRTAWRPKTIFFLIVS